MKEYSEIRAQLLTRRSELESRLRSIKKDISKPLDHDFAEQAVELENDEVLQALGTEAESEINKINNALIRMDEDRYGECVTCGGLIPAARLAIRPFSSRCIDCATKEEQHE
ncbi:TraR/DksA family transcriptional regulator [Alkalimarinus alittae]|uniref:TraR/DksA C4-type zinc finger protein n=1 Tax=Alkalimarinus alittae TaxID=2961619 RepID=A0ABY6N0P5_9ALTE|nr:TraR/DksA C4-type zinc finger protein [Alkalimarinus alittae]UZE95678.1 TraR/DksA C4-type zinc finger protein [Alkalimarinus alittae]